MIEKLVLETQYFLSLYWFLVQSALLGWLWGLPAAKELRHYGTMALWRYGAMALWRYGAMALWRYGAMALWR